MRLTKLSTDFVRKLAEYSGGGLSSSGFDKLINRFEDNLNETYFTGSSEANLLRIIQGVYNRVSLLKECVKYPHYTEILVSIAANSNYLTDILVINPEYFHWIVNPSVLNQKLNKKLISDEIASTADQLNTFNAKVNALKSLKRKEILRIGLKDIFRKAPLVEITEELSILAKALTGKLFSICHYEILQKYGIEKTGAKYSLISLGKLGGRELNYSSDIDLILFYEKDIYIKRKKHYSEILTEATHLFLNSAAKGTGGMLYRIDFRLRPDGNNSPLCRSIREYFGYYESRGEDWERQMLIKADFLTGSKNLYNKFINYLSPFIYPSSLSTFPKQQILKMKKNIERKLSGDENIKLSYGGIRDIEFSVQALQLLNGGRIKNIKTGNTLNAIEQLKQNKLLSNSESKILSGNYIIYRRIEHYLQLMNDRQTHVIPFPGEMAEKLSFFLGYKNVNEFKKDLSGRRNEVRKIYSSILAEDKKKSSGFLFDEINFEDQNKARKDLQYLREGKSVFGEKTFDAKSIKSFTVIEPEILKELKISKNPDKLLSNFVRIIKYADFPSIWYKEMQDKRFLKYFLEICTFSQYAIDLFAEDKELREFFLSRKVFMKIPAYELTGYPVKEVLFYYSVNITLKLLNPVDASKILTSVIIKKVKEISDDYSKRFGWKESYFIAALGSLGASETTFASDIDLIFIAENLSGHKNIEGDFQNLLELLRNKLHPFKLDCRLRPEGKSSQLVWDIEEYKKYFNTRARIWEHLALTKISFVSGNRKIFNSFIQSLISSINRLDRKTIKTELTDMRKKISAQSISSSMDLFDIKKSTGGLTDIDFIVEYLILCNPQLLKRCGSKNTPGRIKILMSVIKEEPKLIELINAFVFLKSTEIYNQIIFSVSSSKISMDEKKLNNLYAIMDYNSVNKFRKDLNRLTNQTSKLFRKYFD